MHNLKDLVKGNVYFVEYYKGVLWYEAGRHSAETPFRFPIPIGDTSDRIFLACDKSIFFTSYIRIALEELNGSLA